MQHPVPILPLLGRAARQHIPLKMMHGFVMHQRKNIKEFNSCTELCGDCIRLVWKVHNTSHMLQEHDSVYSIPLHHCAPFLRRGAMAPRPPSRACTASVGWERNHEALQFSPHPTKLRLFIPKPCELPWPVCELCLHTMCNSSAPHHMCRALNSSSPPLPALIQTFW